MRWRVSSLTNEDLQNNVKAKTENFSKRLNLVKRTRRNLAYMGSALEHDNDGVPFCQNHEERLVELLIQAFIECDSIVKEMESILENAD